MLQTMIFSRVLHTRMLFKVKSSETSILISEELRTSSSGSRCDLLFRNDSESCRLKQIKNTQAKVSLPDLLAIQRDVRRIHQVRK